jgi:hypothetical protein
MFIGEFTSEDVGRIILTEEDLRMKYLEYCVLQDKIFKSQMFMTASGPLKFILKIYIENGNNGEIENC